MSHRHRQPPIPPRYGDGAGPTAPLPPPPYPPHPPYSPYSPYPPPPPPHSPALPPRPGQAVSHPYYAHNATGNASPPQTSSPYVYSAASSAPPPAGQHSYGHSTAHNATAPTLNCSVPPPPPIAGNTGHGLHPHPPLYRPPPPGQPLSQQFPAHTPTQGSYVQAPRHRPDHSQHASATTVTPAYTSSPIPQPSGMVSPPSQQPLPPSSSQPKSNGRENLTARPAAQMPIGAPPQPSDAAGAVSVHDQYPLTPTTAQHQHQQQQQPLINTPTPHQQQPLPPLPPPPPPRPVQSVGVSSSAHQRHGPQLMSTTPVTITNSAAAASSTVSATTPRISLGPHYAGTQAPATAPSDALTGLAAQLNGLSVGPISQAPRAFADDSPRPPPLIRASGSPNEVLSYCPEERAIDYTLYWYQLPEEPDFQICTKCHLDHIRGTALASRFDRIKRSDGVSSSCYFWVPRVVEVLWPQALRSGQLDALCSFMKKRVGIKACRGRVAVPASAEMRWFGMVNGEINGFISCEACYEDRVVGSSFERRFCAYQKQKEGEMWSCDVCVPFISRCIGKMAKMDDWPSFVAAATRRLQLPACEGKDVQSNSCVWYLPRREIPNLRACEACYMDKLALTRFENHFQRLSMSNDLDSFIQQFTTRWSCKLTASHLPMAFALDSALERRDWRVFEEAATVICRLAACTANGIIRGNWWTLPGGCADFDVCEACYVGILRTGGTAHLFEPAQRSREATLVCDFCVASPRFPQYIRLFAQALDTGVLSCYTDFVRAFAAVPVCPGIKRRERGKWWGYPEVLFCEDCYLSFVAKTSLGGTQPIRGGYDERPQICQMWSPRMRTMWTEVCAAQSKGSAEGESERALDKFRAFGQQRLEVYVKTVPQMEHIRAMKDIRMQNAMHQGLLSVMYNGMDGLAQVSGATDGHLHGNSQLGWFATEQGATGAQMFNNMQAGFASANRADEWMQMAQLEMVWKQVE